MINHKERATELFKQGYNCAQSVFGSFSEDLGIDFETAVKIASSFGAGMGRLREVCGAVSGMFMVVGYKYGHTNPKDYAAKTEHYKLVQELALKFKEINGSIVCRELLGLKEKSSSPIPERRTASYYKKRPCAELVGIAAELVEETIKNKQNIGGII